MKHSVKITTPMPTWEETADFYGLSKSDRKFITNLVQRKVFGVKDTASAKSPFGSSKLAKGRTRGGLRIASKTVGRVRKSA